MNNRKDTIDNLAMVVMSCDAYQDVALHFFALKDKYMPWWNNNCYYVNENSNFTYKNVKTINGGNNNSWNERLKKALRKIPEKYVLYMQEDYLVNAPVIKSDIQNAIDYMKRNNIWYYKIDALPKINKKIDENHSAIPSNKRYGINLLTAIIEKEKFLQLLPKNAADAWEVEHSFLNLVTDEYEYDLKGCVLNTKKIISIEYGVRGGKWMKSVVNHFRKKGYYIDTSKRGVMNKKDSAKLKIKGSISHILTTKQIRNIKRIMKKTNIGSINTEK